MDALATGVRSKRQKYRIHRFLKGTLDGGNGHTGVKRRYAVLQQQRQFVGDVGRQQVAARGQHLAKLHEDGAQLLQRLAQALAPGRPDCARRTGMRENVRSQGF